MARAVRLMLLCALAACGQASRPFDDANPGPPDARVPDANPEIIPDAMPELLPPTPSREVVNGAGRMSGATYTLDVEIGPPISQQPAARATHTIEGNTAIKP